MNNDVEYFRVKNLPRADLNGRIVRLRADNDVPDDHPNLERVPHHDAKAD
jgi:hypothetical protein